MARRVDHVVSGQRIDADVANFHVDATNQNTNDIVEIKRKLDRREPVRGFWARAISGSAAAGYKFKQVYRNSAGNGWADRAGGLATDQTSAGAGFSYTGVPFYVPDDAASLTTSATTGDVVYLKQVGNVDGDRIYVMVSGAGGGGGGPYFPVDITQTAGSNGTATSQASYTYNVFEIGTTTQIGTALAPVDKGRRLGAGPVTAATKGMAYYDSNGDLVLEQAYEVHGTVACPD